MTRDCQICKMFNKLHVNRKMHIVYFDVQLEKKNSKVWDILVARTWLEVRRHCRNGYVYGTVKLLIKAVSNRSRVSNISRVFN